MASGQMPQATSPTWAVRRKNMHMPRLADAAAHRLRQLAGEEHAVEGQLHGAPEPADLELPQQRRRIDANAHRGNLEGPLEHRVPEQDVAVESAAAVAVRRGPVVVVGGAAVVRLAVGQLRRRCR